MAKLVDVLKQALMPVDFGAKLFFDGLDRSIGNERLYAQVCRGLHGLLAMHNGLTVEGVEHVPSTGGVVLASNHQSWLDVEALLATCPRRVHFLAKAEFKEAPILRRLIELSRSSFILRGGGDAALAEGIEALRRGELVVIFPEGTIPGEEDKMRHDVQPNTGLLEGRTGAVRMAQAAGVPIVPVGVSGTNAALPPEVFPRLELLEAVKPVPITVRYGAPIDVVGKLGQATPSYAQLRTETDALMAAISALVDHSRGAIPVSVPIPPLPTYEKLGVLVLHGFTGALKTVSGIVPKLEAAGIPYRMPTLRGHGTFFSDMSGVTAADWFADAEAALLELAKEVDKVVVMGLSMGGLVALDLGIEHPDQVAGVVTLAAALRFADPLAFATPLMAKLVSTWPAPDGFNDRSLALGSENYPRFTTDAFLSLYYYAQAIEAKLPRLNVPLCVLHSKRDTVIAPRAALEIYRRSSSVHRELHWFERSGHEMGQDCEAEAVFAKVMDFVGKMKR